MPAFEHIHFNTRKMVFLPEDILEYECADGYQTLNKISRGHTICSINGWTPEPQCFGKLFFFVLMKRLHCRMCFFEWVL